MGGMASPPVSDVLWVVIAPLLPVVPVRPKGGRPRVPDRAALTGVLFVLLTGIPWKMLPRGMGCGLVRDLWRRLRDWQEAGVWAKLHHELLTRLHCAGRIDRSRVCMDNSSIPAKKRGGGEQSRPDGSWQTGLKASRRH